MAHINLFYRAFKAYRIHTTADNLCSKKRKEISGKKSKDDYLKAVHNRCIINTDWIEKIEWGLPYIEKAIAEERQFIKNDGEVLNIEKVKRVSKDSVSHLAKHSEYLTKEPPEDDDIVPEKIYMVERMSDYTVYENRFLYMLLCYLRDFIGLRLKKIKDNGNAYKINFTYKRNLETVGGKLNFSTDLEEECKNDPYLSFDEQTLSVLNRIESAQHVIISLLNKPLMTIVAKSPMIKPPITKTNVLKMDLKFKNAVELYEFVSSYKGDGFKIEKVENIIKTFEGELGDELAELINLTSFLTYEYGNNVTSKLKKFYEAEERERSEAAREKYLEELKKLKARLEKGKITPEEYIERLENILKELRAENAELKELRVRHERLLERFDDLKKENESLNLSLINLDAELSEKVDAMNSLNARYEADLNAAEQKRLADLAALSAVYEQKLADADNARIAEIEELAEADRIKYEKLSLKADKLLKEKLVIEATLRAFKKEHGVEDDADFDGKQNFERLEKEFAAYFDFFTEKWTEAKKKLRKEYIWTKAKNLRDKI